MALLERVRSVKVVKHGCWCCALHLGVVISPAMTIRFEVDTAWLSIIEGGGSCVFDALIIGHAVQPMSHYGTPRPMSPLTLALASIP
jgi:hypothetical protein